jgi:hypothetical protein
MLRCNEQLPKWKEERNGATAPRWGETGCGKKDRRQDDNRKNNPTIGFVPKILLLAVLLAPHQLRRSQIPHHSIYRKFKLVG